MVVEALLVGLPQALDARLADGVASSGVLVVGGDMPSDECRRCRRPSVMSIGMLLF